jgi:thiol:disulfide interchange protein DsbD
MRKILFLLLILAACHAGAQMVAPVKWKTRIEKISPDRFRLVFSATIEDGWHVYSQHTPDGGPLAMEVAYAKPNGHFELIGKTKESPYKKHFNDVFGVDEYYFDKSFTLTQEVKVTDAKLKSIAASVDYQVCQNSCINDTKTFTFDLPKIEVAAQTKAQPAAVPADTAKAETPVTVKKSPEVRPVSVSKPAPAEKRGLWSVFFLAFLGGFAALLTPCVFPMIPMTVSFFTKQSKTPAQGKRNAVLYGVSIILIYLVLGSVVTAVFGAEALNQLSTDVWFNLIFFLLLIVFAVSFLGAFEIILPNSWANKVDRQADRGGIIGILFMALALAIVSFSCTGPIVGTLLVESASHGGFAPLVGMFGFSLALALPFMLFAMFPGWLNTLPKSGGWLNTVKVSLGFLELALAFKFLSNADLVLQAHWLEREAFLSIWIAVFGCWAIYLLGLVRFPHDGPAANISVGRGLLGVLVLAFTFYMVPGLFGAPLKLISAFPPPQTYSESPNGLSGGKISMKQLPDGAVYGEHEIVTFDDYDKGLAYAKSVHKPILIDFTGFACVNCRKMEINVWSDEQVLKVLQSDVVLISLHVDDKRPLPENERSVSKTTGKKILTIGNKWTDFIISKYKTNTQPYYVMTDADGNSLSTPVGYTPDAAEFLSWLREGLKNFGTAK